MLWIRINRCIYIFNIIYVIKFNKYSNEESGTFKGSCKDFSLSLSDGLETHKSDRLPWRRYSLLIMFNGINTRNLFYGVVKKSSFTSKMNNFTQPMKLRNLRQSLSVSRVTIRVHQVKSSQTCWGREGKESYFIQVITSRGVRVREVPST